MRDCPICGLPAAATYEIKEKQVAECYNHHVFGVHFKPLKIKVPKLKIEAAQRLIASSWMGHIKMNLPPDIETVVRDTMTRLSKDYPVLASIDILPGDPIVMDASGSLATKSQAAIYLHPHVWLDHGKLKKHAKDWDEAMVDPSIAGLIIHEVGHILDGVVLRKLGSKKYNALLGTFIRDFNGIWGDEAPSAYGQENVFEFIAEAFTAFYQNKHALHHENDLTRRSMDIAKRLWAEFNKVLK